MTVTTLLDTIAEKASGVDRNEIPARYGIELLGSQGLFAPDSLRSTARRLRGIAAVDLSVAFGIWAHTMAITYLRTADTPYVRYVLPALENGTRPGVTGMAPAFKEASGAGTIDLTATPGEDGYLLSGSLAWASNLADDAVIVTAARTPAGERLLVAVDGCAPGVTLGAPFALLGLNATASAGITFENVPVPQGQVLSRDFDAFIAAVRPTFLLLQISECLGVADAAISAATRKLTGLNAVLADDVTEVRERVTHLIHTQDLIAAVLDDAAVVPPTTLLELRLDAARAAADATALEVRLAGGAGYARNSPASRRFREAAFIPVQSPSETQLRWELERARRQEA